MLVLVAYFRYVRNGTAALLYVHEKAVSGSTRSTTPRQTMDVNEGRERDKNLKTDITPV